MERLEKINPFYREKALVREIAREKTKIDFTQKPSLAKECRSDNPARRAAGGKSRPASRPSCSGGRIPREGGQSAAFLGAQKNTFEIL